MVSREILYHPVLHFRSHLVFSSKNINKTFFIQRKNKEQLRGIRRKTHVSWLLKDLQSYNWHQDIRSTVFCNHVKVQVGKDQEKAQSEKDSHSKNRGGKKPN